MLAYIVKIKAEIELKNKKITELENKILTSEQNLQKNAEQFAKLKQQFIESELVLKVQNQMLSDSLKAKQTEIIHLNINLTNCENNIFEKNNQNAKYELFNEANRKKLADLEAIKEENSKTLNLKVRQIDELNKKSEQCRIDLENIRKQNAILLLKNAEINHLQINLKTCENNILQISNKMKSSVDALNMNIIEMRNKNNKLEKNIKQCEKLNREKDRNCKNVMRSEEDSDESESSDESDIYVIYQRLGNYL